MAVSLSNKQLITYFIVILIVSVIIGSISLVYPFGRDQGIYAYIAKLILNGKIDYKYSYNLRPPGTHYAFALGQLIFGESMLGMRIFDILWQSLTGFIIFQIVYLIIGKKNIGLVSAFLYVFLYYRLDYWHTMQTEGFMNLPFALCVLLLVKPGSNRRYLNYFLSGIFFAVTAIFKFTVAAFALLLIILLLADYKSQVSVRLKKAFSFIAGVFGIALIVLLYYYFNNALNQLLEIQFVQIPHYAKIGYETETSGFIFSNIIRLFFYSVYSPLLFLSFVLFVILAYRKKLNMWNSILFIWLISTLLSLIMQWKFFYYHFLIIVPPAVICAAYSIQLIKNEFKEKYLKNVNIAFTALLLLFILFASSSYYTRYGELISFITGNKTMKELYIKYGTTSDSVFTISKVNELTEFVKQNTEAGDGIYIWGIEPLIYYLSGRDCVSRFTYNTPLYWRGDDSRYQKEFIRSLRERNPKLILVAERDPMYNITGYNKDSEQMLQGFTEFKEIIEKYYKFNCDIAEFKIYKLLTPFSN